MNDALSNSRPHVVSVKRRTSTPRAAKARTSPKGRTSPQGHHHPLEHVRKTFHRATRILANPFLPAIDVIEASPLPDEGTPGLDPSASPPTGAPSRHYPGLEEEVGSRGAWSYDVEEERTLRRASVPLRNTRAFPRDPEPYETVSEVSYGRI